MKTIISGSKAPFGDSVRKGTKNFRDSFNFTTPFIFFSQFG